jgi:hypothetical protein
MSPHPKLPSWGSPSLATVMSSGNRRCESLSPILHGLWLTFPQLCCPCILSSSCAGVLV